MPTRIIDLPSEDLIIYESKHGKGEHISPHRHAIPQILYVIDGQGEILLGNRLVPFCKNQAAVILPETDHSIHAVQSLTLLVLAFNPAGTHAFLPEPFLSRYFRQSAVVAASPWISDELRQSFRKMLHYQSQTDALSRWSAGNELFGILVLLARAAQADVDPAKSAKSEKIREYIDKHYYEIRSAAEIAAKFQMSVRHMDQLFKEQYRKTPVQYLGEIRLEHACKLLIETDKAVITICFEVGFEALSTFYRTFKAETGRTPNEYRAEAVRKPEPY